MNTIWFAVILITVLAFYAYVRMSMKEFIQCVEAGPTAKTSARFLKEMSFRDRRKTVIDKDGKIIDTSNMLRVVVQGDCMKPRHISTGDQLLVRKIDKHKLLRDQIKKDDILMIHLKDTGITKIRIFDHYDGEGKLVTYRYLEDESRKDSTRPHNEKDVVGIVKFKV